jgi:hypothetical protein
MQLQENNGLAIDVRLSRDALHNRADERPLSDSSVQPSGTRSNCGFQRENRDQAVSGRVAVQREPGR